MQRTLYNHVIPHIMAQSRVESRQRCVTIIGCVHDHNCGTIRSCVPITSCVYDHNCVCVDPNRERFVTCPSGIGRNRCHGVTGNKKFCQELFKKRNYVGLPQPIIPRFQKRCRSALRRPRAPCWASWLPLTAQHGTRRRWPSWQRSHSRRARCARANAPPMHWRHRLTVIQLLVGLGLGLGLSAEIAGSRAHHDSDPLGLGWG